MKIIITLLFCLIQSAYAQSAAIPHPNSIPSMNRSASIHLDDVPLVDVVKLVYGEIAQKPYIIASEANAAKQLVTFSIKDASPQSIVRHADTLLQNLGYSVNTSAGVVYIDRAKSPERHHFVYRPRYRSAQYLREVVEPLTGVKLADTGFAPSAAMASAGEPQPMAQPKPSEQRKPERQQADKIEPDQIVLSVEPRKLAQLQKLLADLDTPTGEILLKAAVYEVGTTQQDGNAIKLALDIAKITASAGLVLAGDASVTLRVGGLEAVLTALDRDSRFKSISRPQVRVKNGTEARFSVGQDVPILGAQTLDRNGNALQSIDYKPSGIILSAKPEIRDGVIDLSMQQEISSFVTTTTGVTGSPTLTKRSVSTTLSLQPGEVVILAGLQDDKSENQRVSFFDWLGGKSSTATQSEILVFLEAQKLDSRP